ncbi:MAG: SBBP repeat-containing protein [Planctomycetes bacterium]|nr:SBBP repeat-containing protein [Planctomycetota bacterium]
MIQDLGRPLTVLILLVVCWLIPFSLEASNFRRGDINADGELDVSDPIVLLNYLFIGALEIKCIDAADANDDGAADISDAIGLLQYLFLSGSPPREPFTACGTDPTPDSLDCEDFPPCPPILSHQAWIARYNGPDYSHNAAEIVAIDDSGNIYVTGTASGEYATIKYDANGNRLWEARYRSSSSFDNAAKSLAVDGDGNVYLAGSVHSADTAADFNTLKYDARGSLLWRARYNGPGNGLDAAEGLILDGAGNVTVTGYSLGAGTDFDYTTIRYDTNGNQLWTERYNGPDNLSDHALGIAADAAGNVYVTGWSPERYIGNSDFLTIKYTP